MVFPQSTELQRSDISNNLEINDLSTTENISPSVAMEMSLLITVQQMICEERLKLVLSFLLSRRC